MIKTNNYFILPNKTSLPQPSDSTKVYVLKCATLAIGVASTFYGLYLSCTYSPLTNRVRPLCAAISFLALLASLCVSKLLNYFNPAHSPAPAPDLAPDQRTSYPSLADQHTLYLPIPQNSFLTAIYSYNQSFQMENFINGDLEDSNNQQVIKNFMQNQLTVLASMNDNNGIDVEIGSEDLFEIQNTKNQTQLIQYFSIHTKEGNDSFSIEERIPLKCIITLKKTNQDQLFFNLAYQEVESNHS